MRIAILRRYPRESASMDVYADGLVGGLRAVRPSWDILELAPNFSPLSQHQSIWTRGLRRYYERYWRFPRSLAAIEADVFHAIDHSDGHLNAWLSTSEKPNVVTCHDLINLIRPDTFKGRAYLPAASMTAWQWSVRSMEKADRLIAVSAHTKSDMVEHLNVDASRISVVPNAVSQIFQPSSPNRRQSIRRKYGLGDDTLCLLNVGSNNARKNIATLLKAVKVLRDRQIPVRFWKAGAGFDDAQAQFIRTHDLESCTSYLGQPDTSELIEIYQAADALVAPSTYEGFGLTVLEAMACGTPAIAANVTSLPEVAGDAAIWVDPMDADAIADGAARLYRDPAYRQQLSDRGLARARTFTWEGTAEQVAQIYETLLGHDRAPELAMASHGSSNS
ncbi:MAG: glycosyltransferase family 1 protein [Cyanobacteria bacterium J06639_1]